MVHADIAADGSIAGTRIVSSSGDDALDRAALAAIKRARFAPALRGGIAVAGSVEQLFRFHLSD